MRRSRWVGSRGTGPRPAPAARSSVWPRCPALSPGGHRRRGWRPTRTPGGGPASCVLASLHPGLARRPARTCEPTARRTSPISPGGERRRHRPGAARSSSRHRCHGPPHRQPRPAGAAGAGTAEPEGGLVGADPPAPASVPGETGPGDQVAGLVVALPRLGDSTGYLAASPRRAPWMPAAWEGLTPPRGGARRRSASADLGGSRSSGR